jgi:MEMO1 family protein
VVATVDEGLSFPLADRPRLRPVEVFPVHERGRRSLVLRDPADPRVNPIVVADGAAEVLTLLDGQRTPSELVTALLLRGATVTHSQLTAFLSRLDEAGFLDGPRAEHRFAERKMAFLADPMRAAIHAGGAYPADIDELPRTLAVGFMHADGPGGLPGARGTDAAPLRAAIAPHVDLHRGAPTYSWAYRALAEAQPAELYMVLGTCHTPVEGHFAATRKAYDTPLGAVPADTPFLDRLGRLFGRDLYAGEFSHAGEHSIEFQAVYLRSLGLAGEGENAAPIVPILFDSLHTMVRDGALPSQTPLVADFLGALRQALADDGRRITLIAAVDLAHIGPRFGDRWPVDLSHQAEVERGDREMLDHVLAPDADAYYLQVMRDRDARRICGLTPIYFLTGLMRSEGRTGALLRYTKWVDTDLSSSVTFASATYG